MSRRIEIDRHTNHIEQYTEEDIRFYEEDGVYYPSVTTVLDVLPKKQLEIWRAKVGEKIANDIMYEASLSGTKVHAGIDELCLGILNDDSYTLAWFDEFGRKRWKAIEWEGILRFVDFYNDYVEEIILTEQRLTSETLFTGGTVDLVAKLIDGRVGVIDHKFANAMSDGYSIQTWAYAEMVKERYGLQIDFRANLWLKAKTRGADKSGKKIQGRGWQLVEHTEHKRDETIWKAAQTIALDMHRKKELVPEIKTYPTTVSIKRK